MPNNSYLRSRRREWQLMNNFREIGYDACRSAGSHSAFDVWAWNEKDRLVTLVQIKTKKGSRKAKIKNLKTFENVIVKTMTLSYE